MTELTASRTLVKSPPELWAECSDAASLSRHLDGFGPIRITRLEPETVVAWEGESASGTVRLEPSGWGTKVVLTAAAADAVADVPAPVAMEPAAPAVEEPAPPLVDAPAPPAAEDPAPPVQASPAPAADPPRGGVFARLLGLLRRRPGIEEPAAEVAEAVADDAPAAATADPPPAPAAGREPPPPPSKPSPESAPTVAVELMALEQALDSLGQAHHRPFSRS